MRLRTLSVLPIVSLFYAAVGSAIFADEAYQTDYHHALLGFPQAHSTFFHRPSTASKASLLYTLSERLVVGAINPKDGAVIWRQRLSDRAQNDTGLALLRARDGGDTLVTAVYDKVQSWDARDGRLVWEWKGDGRIQGLETTEEERDVLVVSEDVTVRKLAVNTGKILWKYNDTSGDEPYAVLSSENSIFYLSLHPALSKDFKIKITELAVATGKPIGKAILLSSDSKVTSTESLLHVGASSGVPFFVWTDKGLKTLKINVIGTKEVTSANVPSSNGEVIERITVHASRSSTANPHFLIHYQGSASHWAEVYHLDSKIARKAYDLPRSRGKGAFSASSHGSHVYFTRHTESESILVSSVDSSILSQWDISTRGPDGRLELHDITHATSEVLPRGGSAYAVRSALALPSGDWKLIRNGAPYWLRPEGLAGAVAAAFVETATEESLAQELGAESQRGPLAAYMHRLERHLKDLEHFPSWAQALPKRLLGNLMGDNTLPQDQSLRNDNFGFHKIILVATENGRLAALNAGNQGMIVWNVQAVTLRPDQKWHVLSIEDEKGTAVIRCEGGAFLRVVSKTGAIIESQPGGLISSLRTTIPIADASGRRVLVPMMNDGSLGDVPKANLSKSMVIVTEGDDNVVNGWILDRNHKPAMVWRFKPALGEEITKVSARPSHDPVASIGKVLGDRNVLYKYLNPNILLITAIGNEASTATFYILDAASGGVIYSTTHSGIDTDSPVVSTLSENWFAYSLYSESSAVTQAASQFGQNKVRGYQLVVSELYESAYPNDRGSLGLSSNWSSIHEATWKVRDALDTPHVISQTFLIPGSISSMSVTSTLQGITTRSLLCVVPDFKAIISVSRAILEPRRPVGRDPTAAETEEGLFRYSPILEFEPKWILNHKREIFNVANIITSPSLLESTSLVFSFGDIDLFGTRASPIGAFDILGKGFSKLQLMLTVVALALGTAVVAPFVRRKQIDAIWKA